VGVISILEGENPRLIEDKLKSFLSQKEQEQETSGSVSQRKAA
jgi:flagellar motor component MotA